MERSWYWRVALVVAVAILSIYQLVPSWFYFKLPPDQRNTEAYDTSVPGWAPDAKHHLNLGLDLQGGILLSMGVDVDRAVKTKVARRADEIGEFLKGKNVAFTGTKVVGGGAQVEVSAANPGEVKDAVLGSTGYSEEMYSPGGAPDGAVRFAFKDSVLRDFREKAVKQAEKVIRNRVDKWGVTEPDIKTKANNQIQVQLPGFKDPEKAKELLGRTAQLEFKIADDENPVLDQVRTQLPQCQGDRQGLSLPLPESGCWTVEPVELPSGGSRAATMVAANTRTELEKVITEKLNPLLDPQKNVVGIGEGQVGQGPIKTTYYRTYLLRAKTELTGDYIADAAVAIDQSDTLQRGRPVVSFKMSPEGARLMDKLTSENMRRRMATVLDDKVETAPYIQGRISSNGQITLGSGRNQQDMFDEANGIALVLKAGALPAPVTITEERTVGATLGPELVRKGTLAALVGLALVVVFMVVYYRGTGLVADVALALNGLLVLAVMSMIGTTLTLPGIAGFVLTLGMAVDANVLINERIREEMRAGRNVRQSVQLGYDRVFWTIVDSHVTTLVAGVVLFQYGSGPIRGFAVTLIIGLVASMFTSIVVTRVIMEYFTRHDTARLSV
ncbi:protein translocase subunit SecD [Anaeromyxobacter dehalogenans]|uniref:Protein translocase subunit SecD n=1 Tax=Anaeromyxobacter dehalogenans (strain 2CP-C) TaxID=290397 RepID=SECD_ANADE|nr:protein translocase subunit SecD [Anaeromyxobacter dehalogenans]Q2IKX9.1 RecName: Full=Protein translocase subunit SecD [Anaeromyxobacter dehalogenans 2CP-C]ABC82310.1 protein-export membrane protein SecD [Anaeromyxobacter dehalogenans 2CP-C]